MNLFSYALNPIPHFKQLAKISWSGPPALQQYLIVIVITFILTRLLSTYFYFDRSYMYLTITDVRFIGC